MWIPGSEYGSRNRHKQETATAQKKILSGIPECTHNLLAPHWSPTQLPVTSLYKFSAVYCPLYILRTNESSVDKERKVNFRMHFELHFMKLIIFTFSIDFTDKTGLLYVNANQYYFPKINLS